MSEGDGTLARCGSVWETPPAHVRLDEGDVHVWLVWLEQLTWHIPNLERILSADERLRVERFAFRQDRDRFIVGRGLLRVLIGRYLRRTPQELCFDYGQYGKPTVVVEDGSVDLRFNVSHSQGVVLYAVACHREVGVDVERVRAEFAVEPIAERYFSTREVEALQALPVAVREEAFFTCWTRKEAYVKATGKGFSLPLDQFEVSLVPGGPAVLLRTDWDPQEVSRWALQALSPGQGYVAALAVEGHGWQLQCWQLLTVEIAEKKKEKGKSVQSAGISTLQASSEQQAE
ncbi:MAG: 4'-phosphopantetheinyl transferase superfamily protein [Candidatus Latescibacteria bacterium]|nr:4'-phosphopantetheinyl transferase superfamily protein [Candidatus Latescibacterota bacterium]